MDLTRRDALKRVGLAGVATVAGIALVPTPPRSPAPATVESSNDVPDIPGVDERGRLIDQHESPIATFQYQEAEDGYEPTAPINVVFSLARSPGGLERVMAVLEDLGWVRGPEEYVRYAYDYDEGTYVIQEATAAETYYGSNGRRHVRCWQFDDVVSMQAHEDSGARPYHRIESYADARTYLESVYAEAGWEVTPNALDLDNATGPDHDHDGYATLIAEEQP